MEVEPSRSPDAGDAVAPAQEPAQGGRAGRGRLRELVETIVLTIVIFFGIQNFVAQPFQVQQHSMERTFGQGDYVLVDRISRLWSPYARGQVVVFQPPASASLRHEPFIKRVIGLAGDTVEVRDGRVFVNGVALDEPYLYRDAGGVVEPTVARGQSRWIVPAGDLFVMGDHRQVSDDSRVFGPIALSSVVGRGLLRYWPPSVFGIIGTPSYAGVPAP